MSGTPPACHTIVRQAGGKVWVEVGAGRANRCGSVVFDFGQFLVSDLSVAEVSDRVLIRIRWDGLGMQWTSRRLN